MPETLKYLSKEQRDAIDDDPTSIPNLQIALARNPADLASRELLVTRLKAGKLPGEASAQQTYLDYLRGGGSPVVVQLSELLVDELESRGTVYTPEYSPPTLRLVSAGREAVELVHDGGGLVVALPDFRLEVKMMALSRIADVIHPARLSDEPEPDGDDDLQAGTDSKLSKSNSGILPDGANAYALAKGLGCGSIFKRARGMAAKWFKPTDDPGLAEEACRVVESAVMRSIYYFNGWGRLDALALSYVRMALLSFKGSLYETEKGKRTSTRKPHSRTNFHSTKEDEEGYPLPDIYDFEPAGGGFNTGYRRETSAEDRLLVDKMLAALPAPEADILRRYHMEGESSKDIAASLGCSPRTVQRSLAASRKILLEKFADHVA